MTKNEMWEALVERYPEFRDEEFVVKLRSRGLRRLIEQAWDEGFDSGAEDRPNPFESIFGSFRKH